MRTSWLLWVVLAAAGSVVAQGPAAEAPAGRKRERVAEVTGKLAKLDTALQVIELSRRAGAEKFTLSATTKVWINGDPGKLEDFPKDGRVRVQYVREGEPPHAAREILDEASIAILDAETKGERATIDSIEERPQGKARVQAVLVTTAHGKKRELLLRAEGERKSVVMKDGQPVELKAFAVGDKVMLTVRRTGTPRLILADLADEPTFLAFCAKQTLRGKIASMGDAGAFSVAVEGSAERTNAQSGAGTAWFAGGKKVDASPFKVGDDVVVKYTQKSKGLVQAAAVFAPDSWRAYAEWAATAPPPAPAGKRGGQPKAAQVAGAGSGVC
ncbi:MAG: hypothetical protein HYU66_24540 [Armatimonadetes bacterium]|nr:hypothetical protein [Armatimonadota bacterium]